MKTKGKGKGTYRKSKAGLTPVTGEREGKIV